MLIFQAAQDSALVRPSPHKRMVPGSNLGRANSFFINENRVCMEIQTVEEKFSETELINSVRPHLIPFGPWTIPSGP